MLFELTNASSWRRAMPNPTDWNVPVELSADPNGWWDAPIVAALLCVVARAAYWIVESLLEREAE